MVACDEREGEGEGVNGHITDDMILALMRFRDDMWLSGAAVGEEMYKLNLKQAIDAILKDARSRHDFVEIVAKAWYDEYVDRPFQRGESVTVGGVPQLVSFGKYLLRKVNG